MAQSFSGKTAIVTGAGSGKVIIVDLSGRRVPRIRSQVSILHFPDYCSKTGVNVLLADLKLSFDAGDLLSRY